MKMRKRPFILKLLPWLILLLAVAALVIFVFIPIYSEKETSFSAAPEIHSYSGDGGSLVMENDRLLFEMDANTTQFSVTDKVSGKVWYSNPQDRDNDPIALGSNKYLLSSTLNVTYTASGGDIELNNYTYSIQNQTYDVSQLEDGSIRVDYAIGKIEKEYMIPSAITVERFNAFSEQMSKANQKKLKSYYSQSKPEELDKKENKAEFLAMYPTAGEQAMYILKSDIKASNKEKVEEYFAGAGYTREDYELDNQLVAEKKSNNGPVFNASMIYSLEDGDLVVKVPYSEMRCEASAPLTYVSVLPYFGAAGTDQQGSLLIPEGGGALIRFNNGKLAQGAYYANLYGWDYATERREAITETENTFPVFGVVQEDGSFLCIIEEGSAYAGINADVAGRYNSYNFVYSKYNVIHYDRFNVSARTTEQMYMYEIRIPQETVTHRYRFVEGGDYVKMAQAYRDYLSGNPDMKNDAASEDMPVNIELVGAINKVVPKLGIPVDSVVAVTTFDEADAIMKELQESGVKDLSIRMTGWANDGVRQKVLTGVHTVGQIGGDNGMKKLIADAGSRNVSLYFDGINCFAYDSGFFDGFTAFSDAARFTTREQVKLYNYDIITFQQADYQDPYYLVKPGYASKNADNLINGLASRGAAGVAFRDIGNLLSSDYTVTDLYTREMVKAENVKTLKNAAAKGLKISIKEGNDYAVPYADLITDMNLTGNAYAIINERIPFYQIALHGMKDYTGEAINLAGDHSEALLECAEYGAGLNYTFMKADTSVLRDTMYSVYHSASWDRWRESLIPELLRYQQEMAGLNRIRITGHERLSDEVTVTEYEDGTRVYVNYGDTEFTAGASRIPARDYLVERGKAQ